MKTFVTIAFICFFGLAASAQADNQTTGEQKVAAIEMGLVQVAEIPSLEISRQVAVSARQEVARLYRRSDSRVKKELFFTTSKDLQMA